MSASVWRGHMGRPAGQGARWRGCPDTRGVCRTGWAGGPAGEGTLKSKGWAGKPGQESQLKRAPQHSRNVQDKLGRGASWVCSSKLWSFSCSKMFSCIDYGSFIFLLVEKHLKEKGRTLCTLLQKTQSTSQCMSYPRSRTSVSSPLRSERACGARLQPGSQNGASGLR